MTRSEYAVISAGGWFRVAYDPEEMKFAFNEMVEGAAVRLLFHAWACDPMLEDRRVARMTFQDKSGRFAIRAAVMIDATSHEDLTYAELECRKRVMAEIDRLRREVPGFERAHLYQIADQLGITESRRLLGRYVLRREDMDQTFDAAVALTGHWTRYRSLYQIPYRCLLPAELPNLLVAGRCISVDPRVHHATKEIPACMATGEAAGVAAALAVRTGIDPPKLEVARIREHLLAAGTILSLQT